MWPRSRKWQVAALAFAVIVLAAGGLTYRNRNTVREYLKYQQRNAQFRNSHDGVRKDLADGRFVAGDPMENLTTARPPKRVVQCGRYTYISYAAGMAFDGETIIAKDGRLATAVVWSCTYEHVFFDTLSRAEHVEAGAAYDAVRVAEMRDRNAAWCAVTGVGTFVGVCGQPVPLPTNSP